VPGFAYRDPVDLFPQSWAALRAAVAGLADDDFARPSGCAGWLVRDLVCHLVIDAQDVLITLVTPARGDPPVSTVDDATYWKLVEPPTGDDPLDALIPRLAAAYGDPALLKFHLDDVGSAAGRAAALADPASLVETQGEVLTAGDYLSAYVLEWTLHHLDLLTDTAPPCLDAARALFERVIGTPFPRSFSATDTLLIGTGRREPNAAERSALGPLATRLPLALG
jgi:hypothetical protein